MIASNALAPWIDINPFSDATLALIPSSFLAFAGVYNQFAGRWHNFKRPSLRFCAIPKPLFALNFAQIARYYCSENGWLLSLHVQVFLPWIAMARRHTFRVSTVFVEFSGAVADRKACALAAKRLAA